MIFDLLVFFGGSLINSGIDIARSAGCYLLHDTPSDALYPSVETTIQTNCLEGVQAFLFLEMAYVDIP